MDSELIGPDVPLDFTAFHPDFKLQDKPRTPAKTLDHARRSRFDVGLRYVYEGNIYSEGANTYCRSARNAIRRSWHDVLENRIQGWRLPEVRIHDSRCLGERCKREALAKQGVAAAAKATAI